jgi:hypothetical protein
MIMKKHGWETLTTQQPFPNFITLSNSLDKLESDAEARLEAGRLGKYIYQ